MARTSLLSLAPKVWIDGSRLLARTNLCLQLASLFATCKTVTVDEGLAEVRVHRRSFWFFTREWRRTFREIETLDYRFYSWREDRIFTDRYQVALVTTCSPRPLPLFTFFGDDADASQSYFDLLCLFTGKKSTKDLAAPEGGLKCSGCGRLYHRHWRKCMYCGAPPPVAASDVALNEGTAPGREDGHG